MPEDRRARGETAKSEAGEETPPIRWLKAARLSQLYCEIMSLNTCSLPALSELSEHNLRKVSCSAKWHSNSWTFFVQRIRAIKPDDVCFQNCFNGRQLCLPLSCIKFKPCMHNTPICWWVWKLYSTIIVFSKQRKKHWDFSSFTRQKLKFPSL